MPVSDFNSNIKICNLESKSYLFSPQRKLLLIVCYTCFLIYILIFMYVYTIYICVCVCMYVFIHLYKTWIGLFCNWTFPLKIISGRQTWCYMSVTKTGKIISKRMIKCGKMAILGEADGRYMGILCTKFYTYLLSLKLFQIKKLYTQGFFPHSFF